MLSSEREVPAWEYGARASGLSLVELIAGMSILLTATTLMVPISIRWVGQQQVRSAADSIALALSLARLESISTRIPHVVTFDGTAGQFDTFRDTDGDAMLDTDEQLISNRHGRLGDRIAFRHPAGASAVQVDVASSSCDCASFDERGYRRTTAPPYSPAAIYVGDRYDYYLRVVVSFAGSVRVESYRDGSWQ